MSEHSLRPAVRHGRGDASVPAVGHGGALDAAVSHYGGRRSEWIDLSTGINPVPYPLPHLPPACWSELPDKGGEARLLGAARRHWKLPAGCSLVAAPGVSALIAALPRLAQPDEVAIPSPTYGEFAAAFQNEGWSVTRAGRVRVVVHPNNPDGRRACRRDVVSAHRDLTIIDESFCDTEPDASLASLAGRPGFVVLKGIGKFWGLAGLRLGFAACDAGTARRLRRALGPWPVSGPALHAGRAALEDAAWARAARIRLRSAAARLDGLMQARGLPPIGGTSLFRLYRVGNAAAIHAQLARKRILARRFDYAGDWLRLGLPGTEAAWERVARAIGEIG